MAEQKRGKRKPTFIYRESQKKRRRRKKKPYSIVLGPYHEPDGVRHFTEDMWGF